jgi:hypothetical protein
MPMMARIKPFDPQMGHVVRRYTVNPWETRFEEARGWYLVPDEWAKYLATLHQQAGNKKSPKLFDVVSVDEAKRIEAEEKAELEEKAETNKPVAVGGAKLPGGDMGTADLKPTPVAPKPVAPPSEPAPAAEPAPEPADEPKVAASTSSSRRRRSR